MTNAQPLDYAVLANYAGSHLIEAWPTPFHIGVGEAVPDCPAAVYVAIDVEGKVAYVGSALRKEAAASRLAEHLRRHDRFRTWDYLFVFPLKEDTPLRTVLRIEGRIGAHLRPPENKRLPSISRKS